MGKKKSPSAHGNPAKGRKKNRRKQTTSKTVQEEPPSAEIEQVLNAAESIPETSTHSDISTPVNSSTAPLNTGDNTPTTEFLEIREVPKSHADLENAVPPVANNDPLPSTSSLHHHHLSSGIGRRSVLKPVVSEEENIDDGGVSHIKKMLKRPVTLIETSSKPRSNMARKSITIGASQGKTGLYTLSPTMTNCDTEMELGSEFEVVLEDGTHKKRTVSLTTNLTSHRYSTSPYKVPTAHQSRDNDPLLSYSNIGSSDEESDPLKRRSRNSWNLSRLRLSTIQKNVLKGALAYFLTAMLTFVPYIRNNLFDEQSTHVAAISVLFFNPARPLGALLEEAKYGICGIIFGTLVGISSLLTTIGWNMYFPLELQWWTKVINLVFWCGGTAFIMAYYKARIGKPTIYTGVACANILIFILLVRCTSKPEPFLDTNTIIATVKGMVSGVLIALFVSFNIFPENASDNLRTDISKTLQSFRTLLKLLTKTFLMDPGLDHAAIQKLLDEHRNSITSLKKSLGEASNEFHKPQVSSRINIYSQIVASLNQLTQHLGGLSSSVSHQMEVLGKQDSEYGSTSQKRAEAEMLQEFIYYVGPPMRSLAFTCKQTIMKLEDCFQQSKHIPDVSPFHQLSVNLSEALAVFERSQSLAVTGLYKRAKFDGRPNEEVFLVYFFVFSLQEFTRELGSVVKSVESLWKSHRMPEAYHRDQEYYNYITDEKYPALDLGTTHGLHTPEPHSGALKLSHFAWKFFSWFRTFEAKFALKTAIATTLLMLPAFHDEWRSTYYGYRGEWALISLGVAMVPSVGGSNMIGMYRLLGTFFGGIFSYGVYALFPAYGPVMAAIVFLFAIPCYYIILYTKHPLGAQFSLLTLANILLNGYAPAKGEPPHDIGTLAFKRVLAVSTGVIFGLIFTNYVWPYEARVELRKELSQFFLRISELYHKLVAMYSSEDNESNGDTLEGSSNVPINIDKNREIKEFLDLELQLQLALLNLHVLLSQTSHEPRLKGPYPQSTYKLILVSCQNLLDKLLAMRIAVTKEVWFQSVREDFVMPVNDERKQMVGCILLSFYIFASALRIKTPLPPYLPPANEARQRLVARIRELPVVKMRHVYGNDAHYIFYYAYVLVLEDVIREIDKIGTYMKLLFGCVGGAQFEGYFRTPTFSDDFSRKHSVASINSQDIQSYRY
ncbi:hypothetical protein K7432_010102 [Basidiobolus ranarum]|uniref:DUF2421 domain-containing protein n=1 Tax=Basidiobolus ranarum TaxID=34480 RepID=A0ABR2VW46_9FUNG